MFAYVLLYNATWGNGRRWQHKIAHNQPYMMDAVLLLKRLLLLLLRLLLLRNIMIDHHPLLVLLLLLLLWWRRLLLLLFDHDAGRFAVAGVTDVDAPRLTSRVGSTADLADVELAHFILNALSVWRNSSGGVDGEDGASLKWFRKFARKII